LCKAYPESNFTVYTKSVHTVGMKTKVGGDVAVGLKLYFNTIQLAASIIIFAAFGIKLTATVINLAATVV
jgi:hypothetical protein